MQIQPVSFQGLLNLFENTEDNPRYHKFKRVLEDLFEGLDVVNEILKIEPLFITKTAEELQWGYEDPVFKLVHTVDPSLLPSAVFSLRVSGFTSKLFVNCQVWYVNCLANFFQPAKGAHSVTHCCLFW